MAMNEAASNKIYFIYNYNAQKNLKLYGYE